ncbi:hypothetical protein BV25DRAFT_424205 [Artomyces pyxidatus]|uniref:Uncharacterized protein n=1 Tax=Artomyces pyxidatus TaxID=48021 RepID=A0ACB8T5I3_9AGAM|nr:hypothetical protein BV25DRAFT_424205 [Artomyces pyxidatus]
MRKQSHHVSCLLELLYCCCITLCDDLRAFMHAHHPGFVHSRIGTENSCSSIQPSLVISLEVCTIHTVLRQPLGRAPSIVANRHLFERHVTCRVGLAGRLLQNRIVDSRTQRSLRVVVPRRRGAHLRRLVFRAYIGSRMMSCILLWPREVERWLPGSALITARVGHVVVSLRRKMGW